MTGYLVWGFLIIYLFGVVSGLVIFGMRLFVGDKIWLQLFLKALPVLVALIFRKILLEILSRLVFLNMRSSNLAIDNFRAFNIFLYFNFFFDAFMGFVSAFIRLIKGFLLAILMMPSNL